MRKDVLSCSGRFMRMISIGAATLCTLIFSSFVRAQDASTVIRLHYTSTNSCSTSTWIITAKLIGGKQVEESHEATSERYRGGWQSQTNLGGRWRVISENKLRRIVEHPNHFQIWDVAIKGRGCYVAMKTQPGKSEYLLQGINRKYSKCSRPHYTNVYCTIQ